MNDRRLHRYRSLPERTVHSATAVNRPAAGA